MAPYPALPGYYEFIFVWFEPISEIGPIIGSLMYGPSWFYNELVPPTGPPPTDLDPRAAIAIWQLTVAYLLMFIMTSAGYRMIVSTVPKDFAAQERLTSVFLGSLAIADLIHIFLTFMTLPSNHRFRPHEWNTTTHGNLTVVGLLHLSRIAWFTGVGRKRFYFGQAKPKSA